MKSAWIVIMGILFAILLNVTAVQATALATYQIQPGDTWEALAFQFQTSPETLQSINPHPNPAHQPAIGSTLVLPDEATTHAGVLLHPNDALLLETAVRTASTPWAVAIQNEFTSPYHPTLYRSIFIPGGSTPPRSLPPGFDTLELSQLEGHPGQALGLRAQLDEITEVTAVLGHNEMDVFINDRYLVGLTGTGAFFGTQQPTLQIQVEGEPPWRQPWQFRDPTDWEYQQLTLTGTAAQIDQQSIDEERARLFAIWEQNSGPAQWDAPFQLPLDNYLEISSTFGARRSYNGGPYRAYHEGVDFAAYGGTPVLAPASGTVVVAETLYVRGGAVIIDHGLGIYSGFYHMSSLSVAPGDVVQTGQIVGEVGTTGLSTGNHLHWDLLVDGIWVDAQAWLNQGMDCWILAGLNQPCP